MNGTPPRFDRMRRFRQGLRAGPAYGPFAKTRDPALIEAMGYAGFDFVILDMEHGPHAAGTLEPLIRAAEIAGILPIVRVSQNAWSDIGAALDLGAGGIQVPQIATPEQAARAVRHARFAPQGERGVCRFVRNAAYGAMEKSDYFHHANEALVVVQLEGEEALENLDDILSVAGIDIVFIGPYDLSQSLGIPGEVEHPRVCATIDRIAKAGEERGIPTGCFAETPEKAARWTRSGIRYLGYSVDIWLFQSACAAAIDACRDERRCEPCGDIRRHR
jgi:4-hydroxy-2-oxoheptanedioate aldolase